jgi:hypothetical protein
VFLEVPVGTSRTIALDLAGVLDDPLADTIVRRQPMSLPQRYEVTNR